MTPEEKQESGSVCSNHEPDVRRAPACGAAYGKAASGKACDGSDSGADPCVDVGADPGADPGRREREQERRRSALGDDAPISGWLAFFLWVGLGGGGLLTLVMMLRTLACCEYSFFFTFLLGGTVLLHDAVAVYAIYAFYKRLPNAVAVAKTYIAMVVIDGVTGGFISLLVDDYPSLLSAVRPLVWASIWYSYLSCSARVEARIPSALRTWGAAEKYALAFYSLGCVTILAMSYAQSATNVLLSADSYIRQTVEATKDELPIDMGDGVEITNLSYEEGAIRYDVRFRDTYKRGLDPDALPEYAEQARQEILEGWAAALVSDEFMAQCCRKKLTIIYRYLDRAGELLYQIVITPEDYKDRLWKIDRMDAAWDGAEQ